jgi:hypothetical protein
MRQFDEQQERDHGNFFLYKVRVFLIKKMKKMRNLNNSVIFFDIIHPDDLYLLLFIC